MKKILLTTMLFSIGLQAQSSNYWNKIDSKNNKITPNLACSRENFPEKKDLYNLNLNDLRSDLFALNNKTNKNKVEISIPNAKGSIESFEIYEASNFDSSLQAQFPEIRAYSGKGLTDKGASLKLSISPYGIQTMVTRIDGTNEFMEPYSQNRTTYALYTSESNRKSTAWSCSTEDKKMINSLNESASAFQKSNAGQLKTMRLAQSCTGEYSQYHATTVGQPASIAISLAAFNNTMTRCNGVYEKDLGLHLNLIANTTSVIYLNAATDPYGSTDANYNSELQTTLTNIIGDANYDIGHLFSAIGNNGNAGCIGCVCENGKGSAFTTSTAPIGDNFDIDFVVHEVGHQLGANHTFTHGAERTGNNMEPGSGITIMGYAGITGQDLAPHSIDTFHATSIKQIQNNLAPKTCPVTTAANNAAPAVNAGKDFVIPKSTPFILEGSATDIDGDVLTYQWEQFDHDTASQTGANSDANATKTIGPNWQSWAPVTHGNRYMPKVSSLIANSATTAATGNDAGILTEALSSVARDLNFRLTVRDNHVYSSVAPTSVGQTNYDDMKVTVDGVAGPFAVTAPSNTGLSYVVGSNQTITWNVASTNAGNVNCQFVDIYLFTDNTLTNGILLASKVPNDGSELVTIPNNVGTTNRIMVRGNGNIFFDISNNNFSITNPTSSFAVAFTGVAGEQNKAACQGDNTINYTFEYTPLAGFSDNTNFSATGVPANTNVVFTPTSRNAAGPVTMTVTTTATTPVGVTNIIANASSGATTKTVPFYLNMNAIPGALTLSTPSNNATTQNTNLNLTWAAANNTTLYTVELASNNTFTNIITTADVTSTNYQVSGLSQGTDYYWRVTPKNSGCNGVTSSIFKFTTGVINCTTTAATGLPKTIPDNSTTTSTLVIPAGSGVTIADLNVSVNMTHTWIGDTVGTLKSPTGTTVTLFSRPCDNGSANNNIVATFDDSGANPICPGISGTVKPVSALSAFNGQTSAGTWTLTINDQVNADSGTLNSWSLNICKIDPVLSNPEFEFSDLRVYPNPNKGNFNIEFNSESDKDIQVNVFDLSGREITTQTYKATGIFKQNINLNNAQSGIYLVTITDGTKKAVKRIVIE